MDGQTGAILTAANLLGWNRNANSLNTRRAWTKPDRMRAYLEVLPERMKGKGMSMEVVELGIDRSRVAADVGTEEEEEEDQDRTQGQGQEEEAEEADLVVPDDVMGNVLARVRRWSRLFQTWTDIAVDAK